MSGVPTYVIAEKIAAMHVDTDYTTDKKPTVVYLEGTDPFWVSETPEQVRKAIDSAMRHK